MPIEHIHSYLVSPGKNLEVQPQISGTAVLAGSSLHRMLGQLFDRANEECDTEIQFRPTPEGVQQNGCRDDILTYAQGPTLVRGRLLATRLQLVSTNRSNLGLLFLMKGTFNGKHQFVISRFAADQGVVARQDHEQLTVEFVEQVFMKNAKAYKSALYAADAFEGGFWHGWAIDRQSDGKHELSDYWIREFLESELRTTTEAGTRRLAVALVEAIRHSPNAGVREELIAATTLFRGQDGQRRTSRQFIERMGLSPHAITAIENQFPRAVLMDQAFRFSTNEFQRHAAYRSIELDNGGVMIAEESRFNEVFHPVLLNAQQRTVRYTTEGRIVDESLRKTK